MFIAKFIKCAHFYILISNKADKGLVLCCQLLVHIGHASSIGKISMCRTFSLLQITHLALVGTKVARDECYFTFS